MEKGNFYGYMGDIIDCIQEKVDRIAEIQYENDECKPIFNVSVLWEEGDEQSIVLTCTHLGRSFSRVLFPEYRCFYGYDSLESVVKGLYNQTM